MSNHRPAGDRMQHFRHRRFHARAVAGGEDDGKARTAHKGFSFSGILPLHNSKMIEVR
jgi:hypothetical protein